MLPGSVGSARSACALALLAVTAAGPACGGFESVGRIDDVEHGRVAWVEQLYELDMLAYQPRERGQPTVLPREGERGGLVVVPSDDRGVRALDTRDGSLRWSIETRGANVAAPVPVGEEDLLIASIDGRVRRVARATGARDWVSEPVGRGGVRSPPAVGDEHVFVTSSDNRLTALNLDDGSSAWTKRRQHRQRFTITGQAGPCVLGDRVVTGYSDGRLIAYEAADGETAWKRDLSGEDGRFADVDTTPMKVGGRLVVAGYGSGVHALDPDDGDELWVHEGEGFGRPAARGGRLYVPKASGELVALDAASGEARWRLRTTDGTPHTPAVAGRYLLVPVEDGLLVVESSSGRALERFDDRYGIAATPAVHGGRVFAPANGGRLYAFELRAP